MKGHSLWDRTQFILIRWLATLLALVDDLLNVRWGERCLEALSRGWRAKLADLTAALDELEVERQRLHLQTEALALHAATLYLGGRALARDELLFDPADPHDERTLDASIDLLVKEQLAEIETEEVEAGRYIYHLEPDWVAIRGRLAEVAQQVDPEISDWFHQGLLFIDEALLPESAAGEPTLTGRKQSAAENLN